MKSALLMESRKLDIGCGRQKVPGAVGLDCVAETDADIVCDLTQTPWPVAADSFDEVFANNVVEHLPNMPALMTEIHRISRHGALLHIRTPHFASLSSWEDPTHLNHFSLDSFDYFCGSTRHVQHYTRCRFELVSKKLHFGGHPLSFLGRIIHGLSPREYEKYWAFIFRPSTLEIHLRVVKDSAVAAAG
jgi:SAM-dependent methyltransferase